MNQFSIYLRRKNKIIVTGEKTSVNNMEFVLTINQNISNLGYILSHDLIEKLQHQSVMELTAFEKMLIKELKKLVGAHVKYKPMYRNFPKQVMKMKDCELYWNALCHYWGDLIGIRLMPKYKKKPRKELVDFHKPRVLELGSPSDFNDMFRNLVTANTSISEADKTDLRWFLSTHEGPIEAVIPVEIPHKENFCFILATVLECRDTQTDNLTRHIQTATDVLRLASGLSQGDVSLADNTIFRKFSRRERRFLLSLLDSVNDTKEAMWKFRGKWLRLGEKLHPGDYNGTFGKANIFP